MAVDPASSLVASVLRERVEESGGLVIFTLRGFLEFLKSKIVTCGYDLDKWDFNDEKTLDAIRFHIINLLSEYVRIYGQECHVDDRVLVIERKSSNRSENDME